MAQDPKIFLNAVHASLKNKAPARNLLFTVTTDDLHRLWVLQQGTCAISGLPMTHTRDSSRFNGSNVSLDRINSALGYTPGNVQLVQAQVNIMKNDMAEVDFINLVKAIAKKYK